MYFHCTIKTFLRITIPTAKASAAAWINSERLRVPYTTTLGDLFGHILQWQRLETKGGKPRFCIPDVL